LKEFEIEIHRQQVVQYARLTPLVHWQQHNRSLVVRVVATAICFAGHLKHNEKYRRKKTILKKNEMNSFEFLNLVEKFLQQDKI